MRTKHDIALAREWLEAPRDRQFTQDQFNLAIQVVREALVCYEEILEDAEKKLEAICPKKH